jgi:hypothetical protein
MTLSWFRLKGVVFLPVSFAGWLISLVAVAYAVYAFIEIDNHSPSAGDTLVNFIYKLMFILATYTVIAFITCAPPEDN